ncbi:MFS transporter [Microbacterium sp. 18062]|uniref:MFS transporter n=1 Tax=Microbacterium sp. 18062 TaxID=2681410 RepID=UPI001358F53E|nr:MFS transporter [Microbacterium sp. 18062]
MTLSTTSPSADAATARFPLRALLLLSTAVLVTVTAESLPAGLLPEMAADLRVSPERIGTLISVWALTVIVTSVPLSRALLSVDRRLSVVISLVMFALANLVTAIAPDYGVVLAARVLAAVAHGVFWSIVIVYATSLLSPGHLGRGLAIVTAGGTAATAIGLPAATLLAQGLGWRAVFVVLGATALVLAVVVLRAMPRSLAPTVARGRSSRGFWGDRSLPAVATFGLVAVLIATAQFGSFTYIRPYLSESASVAPEWSAVLLLVYGAAGLLGVVVAGVLADRFPRGSLIAVLVVFAASFAALSLVSASIVAVVASLVVWGVAFGAVFPLLQTILMRIASERTRPLASAGIVVFFNVGIAAGPWLGAAAGGASTPTTAMAVSACAMVLAAVLGTLGVLLAGLRRAG